jgi:hypothetical protein
MKSLTLILLIGALFSVNVQAADNLIAENPLIVVRVKSFNSLKAIVPEAAMGQVQMAEQMFPFLEKSKEVVVVMTSIIPPVAYAAFPVIAGTKMDGISPALPPNLQATAQLRDDYVFLPLQGALPQTIGKGKLAKNISVIQVNLDVEMINKLNGPMLIAMMQQDFSKMLPSSSEKEAQMLKASIDLYRVYLSDLLKSTKSLDIKVDKKEGYVVDMSSEFISGSVWAAICEDHSTFTIPKSDVIKNDTAMVFAGEFDYSSMKPLMDSMGAPMKAFGEAIGMKDINKLMDSFIKIGRIKTVGSMSMNKTVMDMNYVMEGEENADLSSMLEMMTATMASSGEFLSMTKLEETVAGQPVYKYSVKAMSPEIVAMDSYMMAKDNSMYYASDIAKLKKLSESKLEIEKGTKKGFMWMKMDLGGISKSMGLPVPVALPSIESIFSATSTGMRSIITIK